MKKEPPLQPQRFPAYVGFFKITSIFDAIFDLTYLHFGTKNRSWGVLGRLGSVLGRLGRLLAASWAVLGASWRVLGASWGVLVASWARLGPSWARLGSQNHPQDKPDSTWNGKRRFCCCISVFRFVFFDFFPFLSVPVCFFSACLRSARFARYARSLAALV